METSGVNPDSDTNHLALRVALQTMKERCVSLQRRLIQVEEDNQQLRQTGPQTQQQQQQQKQYTGAAENFHLRMQVADLQRQKNQLNDHINMVSNENRKLWSRLSQMAKEQQQLQQPLSKGDPKSYVVDSNNARNIVSGSNQNLIRSKTFTQHSPNPHLRHKLLSDEGAPTAAAVGDCGATGDMANASLEEVGIEAIDNISNELNVGDTPLAFAYLTVTEENASNSEDDNNREAKICLDNIRDMKREAIKQKHELSVALQMIESRLGALQSCSKCTQQKLQKPKMADKSLETDDSLSETKQIPCDIMLPAHSSNRPSGNDQPNRNHQSIVPEENISAENKLVGGTPVIPQQRHQLPRFNIIQEKIAADAVDKMCPMCGYIFGTQVSFDAFRQHVENHFIDDSLTDYEGDIDRNFEMVSHTVGDF